MKLRDMELLLRVAESGSMTTAARQLHITPAAVSAAVQRAEEALGLRLFERTTRSLQATDEGLVVMDACRAVLDRWAQSLEAVQGPHVELSGSVQLSAPADTSYDVLAPVLASLVEAHRKLDVILHAGDAMVHLHRDAIDMAIRYGALPDSQLSARKLVETPVILVASPAYLSARGAPRRPEALARHRCVTLQLAGTPVNAWTLHRGSREQTVALASPLCGDGHLTRRWALAGVGIARKALFDVIDDLERGDLVRVLPRHTAGQTPIHVVFPSRRHLPARVRVVDRAIEQAFRERAERCRAWLGRSEDG